MVQVQSTCSKYGGTAVSDPGNEQKNREGLLQPWYRSRKHAGVAHKNWWRRRESNPANSMIWTPYRRASRTSPRPAEEMSGPRALSRATKPNPADSVDHRDHGGFVRRNLRLGNEAVRHPRFFWSEHESPRSCDFLHVFREGYRAWFHKCSRGFSSFMCPACATVTPEYRPRFSRCCPSRCAARLSLHAGSAHPWPPTLKAARSSFATRSGPPWDLQRLSMGEDGPRRRRRSRRRRPDRRRNPPPGADSRIQTTVSSAYPPFEIPHHG